MIMTYEKKRLHIAAQLEIEKESGRYIEDINIAKISEPVIESMYRAMCMFNHPHAPEDYAKAFHCHFMLAYFGEVINQKTSSKNQAQLDKLNQLLRNYRLSHDEEYLKDDDEYVEYADAGF